MNLQLVERIVRLAGGWSAFAILAFLIVGIWQGGRRPAGRSVGPAAGTLRSTAFILLVLAAFIGSSVAGWRPLPVELSGGWQILALAFGSLLYFPGLALVGWGRLALGKMYFVSSSLGAKLFADHQLVTHGPFAFVRHPIYLGLIGAAFGSLLIYLTWTTALFVVYAFFVFLLRARREEQVLAAEFGEQWQGYCRRVPAFFPRLKN